MGDENVTRPENVAKEWKSAIENQERRIQHLQSTAFQLSNYYFVFQGIIITAIANGSSSLKCRDRWFIVTLSVIPALLNLVSLLIVGTKYKKSLDQQDENWCYYNRHFQQQMTGGDCQAPTMHPKPDPFTKCQRLVYLLLSMLLFIAFTVVTITGCAIMLCRGHHDN